MDERGQDRHVEVRRSIDLRSLLSEAAELLWQVREISGAPHSYKRVEDDLRAVVAELDARAAEANRG